MRGLPNVRETVYTKNDAITHGRLLISVNANGGPVQPWDGGAAEGVAIIIGRARPPRFLPPTRPCRTDTANPAAAAQTQPTPHVGGTATALSRCAHADNKEPRAPHTTQGRCMPPPPPPPYPIIVSYRRRRRRQRGFEPPR